MEQETFTPSPNGDIDKGWTLLAVCWAFVACAFVSTVLRVWIRARITRNLGSDDWVMTAAMTTTIIGAGMVTAEVLNGLGRHEYYLESKQRKLFQAIGWGDWMQTFVTLGLTNISICLFLLRIVDSKRVKQGMYTLIGCLIIFTAISTFLFLGVCRPLNAYWDVGVNGVCFSTFQIEQIVIAQGVLSIVTDIICAALPIIFLRNVRINLRTKMGLCILMSLGVITAACCTVRTVLSGAVTDPDVTWAITSNTAWRLPEVNIGIFCANAPALRPLYLFMRCRLQSQRLSETAFSKESKWPGCAKRAALQQLHTYNNDSIDASASVEMGLPIHKDAEQMGMAKD